MKNRREGQTLGNRFFLLRGIDETNGLGEGQKLSIPPSVFYKRENKISNFRADNSKVLPLFFYSYYFFFFIFTAHFSHCLFFFCLFCITALFSSAHFSHCPIFLLPIARSPWIREVLVIYPSTASKYRPWHICLMLSIFYMAAQPTATANEFTCHCHNCKIATSHHINITCSCVSCGFKCLFSWLILFTLLTHSHIKIDSILPVREAYNLI